MTLWSGIDKRHEAHEINPMHELRCYRVVYKAMINMKIRRGGGYKGAVKWLVLIVFMGSDGLERNTTRVRGPCRDISKYVHRKEHRHSMRDEKFKSR